MSPIGTGKAEIVDEHLDRGLAESDLADERMGAAVAALGRVGETEEETLVAARQILQPGVARGGKGERVAGDVGDRRVGPRRELALDQVVAGDEIGDPRRGALRARRGRGRGRRRASAVSRPKSIRRWE